MQITHKINDFLFTIFPDIEKGNKEALVEKLRNYYTYGVNKPNVTVEGEQEVDIELIGKELGTRLGLPWDQVRTKSGLSRD